MGVFIRFHLKNKIGVGVGVGRMEQQEVTTSLNAIKLIK